MLGLGIGLPALAMRGAGWTPQNLLTGAGFYAGGYAPVPFNPSLIFGAAAGHWSGGYL